MSLRSLQIAGLCVGFAYQGRDVPVRVRGGCRLGSPLPVTLRNGLLLDNPKDSRGTMEWFPCVAFQTAGVYVCE